MGVKPIKQTRGLVAILLALVTVAAAVAIPVSAQGSQVTLTPNQDAYVDENWWNRGSNFGSESSLYVQSWSWGDARTFVQFDLSSIPGGVSVQAATLRLHMYDTPGAVRTYQVRRVTEAWSESGITWDNQASVAGSLTDATSTPDNPGWVEWDVTADVQAFISGAQANRGWRISDSNEGQSWTRYLGRFEARDHAANPSLWPQLVVDYTSDPPTPTPTFTNTPTNTPAPTPTATATPVCGSTYWVSPSDSGPSGWTAAYGDGGAYVDCPDCAGSSAWYGGYDFALPGDATVEGIEVRLDWWLDSVVGTNDIDVSLSWNGGGSWTSASQAATERTSDGNPTDIEGGSSDTWGRMWSASEMDVSSFRVRADVHSDVGSRSFYLDWIPVRLHYCTSSGPIPPTPTPTNTPTPTSTPSTATPTPTNTPTPTPTPLPPGTRFGAYDDFELCPLGASSSDGDIREQPPGLRECGNVLTNPDFETTIIPWVTGSGTLDAVRSSRYSCDSDGRVDSFNAGTYSLLFRCDRLHGYGGYPFQPWAYQDFTVPAFVSTTQDVQTELDVSLYYVVPPETAAVAGRSQDELRVRVQDAGGVDLTSPAVVTHGDIDARGVFRSFSVDLGSVFPLADYAGDTLRLRFDAPNDDGLGNSEFFLDQVRCSVCTTTQPPDPEPGMSYQLGGHLLVILAGQPTEMQGIDVWASQLPDEDTPLDQLDFQYTYSIQDSTYNFYNLNPGTYRIYAEVWVSGNQYSAVQTVTIGAGETNVEVDMTLI